MPDDPVAKYLARYGGPPKAEDPVARYLSRYGTQEPDEPRGSSFFKDRFPKARQAAFGVVDAGLRLGEGLSQNAANIIPGRDPFQRASDFLQRQREGLQERTAPETTGETLARVAGNIVGEGAQYVGVGAAGRRLAGPIVREVGERVAPRLTARLAGSKGIRAEVLKDAAAVAPVDLAVTAVGPENSTLGAIAELSRERFPRLSGVMERLAENPVTRFAGEVAIGGSADFALRGTARGVKGAVSSAREGAPAVRRRIAEVADPSMRQELRQAYTDPMTGLPNQTAFERARARLDADEARDVVMFDLTKSKWINDDPALGWDVGNARRGEVAKVIREEAERRGLDARDTFRAGGDEFVVYGPADRLGDLGDAVARRVPEIQTNKGPSHIRYGRGKTFAEAEAAAQATKHAKTEVMSEIDVPEGVDVVVPKKGAKGPKSEPLRIRRGKVEGLEALDEDLHRARLGNEVDASLDEARRSGSVFAPEPEVGPRFEAVPPRPGAARSIEPGKVEGLEGFAAQRAREAEDAALLDELRRGYHEARLEERAPTTRALPGPDQTGGPKLRGPGRGEGGYTVTNALGRGVVGATVGGLVAPEDEKFAGMAAGAAVGLAGPAAFRAGKRIGRGGFAVDPRGLPMDEASRMARAKAQGFDTKKVWYRGTTERGEKRARHSFEANKGIFVTDNPDVAEIFRYPREYGEVLTDVRPGDLQELYARTTNPLELRGNDAQRFSYDTSYQVRTIEDAIAKGHDSIIAHNIMEGVGDWVEPGTTMVIFDPASVRKTAARFDPANIGKSDLSGAAHPTVVGALGRTAAGAVGGSILASEEGGLTPMGGALAGAAVLGGGPAALRALKGRVKNLDDAILSGSSAAKAVAGTVSDGVLRKALDTRTVGERVKSAAMWLRYKASRLEQPIESLDKLVGGNKVRNELARARGAISAAWQHMDTELRAVEKMVSRAPKSVNALAKAERALELVSLGKEATPAQIATWEQAVSDLGAVPEVRDAVNALRKYYRGLLDMKLDAGVLTPDQYAAIVAKGDKYVPFVPDDVMEWTGTGWRYRPNTTTGVRKSKGASVGDVLTVDPLDQAVLDTYETYSRVGRQRVANVIGGIVEADPVAAKTFLEEYKPPRGAGGIAAIPPGEEVVEALIGGERKWYRVLDNDLYDAWTNFAAPVQGTAMKVLNKARTLMQGSITGHPMFQVANGVRDFVLTGLMYPLRGVATSRPGIELAAGAAVGAGLDEENRLRGAARGAAFTGSLIGARHIGTHVLRTLDAMNDIIGPRVLGGTTGGMASYILQDDDKEFADFLAGVAIGAGVGVSAGQLAKVAGKGGVHANYTRFLEEGAGGMGYYAHNKQTATALRKQLQRDGVKATDFINPKSWWDAVQYVGRAVETAPRLAKFKEVVGSGGDVGDAVFLARDLSLDFSVKPGSKSLRAATQAVPFLNAAIQGMDKMARLLSDKNAVAVGAATIMAPSIALWHMIQTDPEVAEEYNERPLYERNSYWLIPKTWFTGERGFWRVPKPFEAGFVYASLPERLLEFEASKDADAVFHALKDMYGQFTPEGMPVVVGPLIEANIGEHGYDAWRRRPINPDAWSNIPPSMQYDDRTSSLAVAAGQRLGVSPAKIDHVLRGTTGSLGSEALDVTSRLARATGLDSRNAPLGKERTFAKRFHTDPTTTPESELAFWRRYDKVERAYNGVKRLWDAGKVDEARAFYIANQDYIDAYETMQEDAKAMRDATKVRREIREADAPEGVRRDAVQRLNTALSRALRGYMEGKR